MTYVEAYALLAQAVVNIDSGLTTIEKDSPIYKAMVVLIEKRAERLKQEQRHHAPKARRAR